MKPTTPLSKAEQFFFDNAGYSYDPRTQTKAEGKTKSAIAMASAELEAAQSGISFRWEEDGTINSSEFSSKRPYYTLWCCVARSQDGETSTALCGIDFGRGKEPWGSPYRRVVEAELSMELLDIIEKNE